MISMAFYWSLTASQFFDVKRKDFWQMFVHHIVTLLLMSLSWICNLHRVGSLVLVVHDCADIFLEVSFYTYIISFFCLEFFILSWTWLRLEFLIYIFYFDCGNCFLGHINHCHCVSKVKNGVWSIFDFNLKKCFIYV